MPVHRPSRILVWAETLFADAHDAPAPLAETPLALERLGWIGEPVVIMSDRIAGRRLPCDPEERLAWLRARLAMPDLRAAVLDELAGDRQGGEAAERDASERWSALREGWGAATLVTGHDDTVGPARRAGLIVIRVGPRGGATGPSTARADHEARDLLDAVTHLMTADAFGPLPDG